MVKSPLPPPPYTQPSPRLAETMFLGQPISYWLELEKQITLVGPNFKEILVRALIDAHDAKAEVERLRKEWGRLADTIEREAVFGRAPHGT